MKQKPNKRPSVTPPPAQAPKKGGAKTVRQQTGSEPVFEKYATVTALGLISLLVLVIFFEFITGQKYYLFKDIGSDSVNGYYPYLINSIRLLRTDGFPEWSFAMGMGQSIYPGGFTDPFMFIINLMSLKNVAYGIILSDVSKFLVTCWFFFLYLHTFNIAKTASVIGSLLFTLSGFMIVAGSWYHFSLEVVYMAFLLYAFEKLYRDGNWILFPVVIALLAAYSPFNLFFYGLFLIIYFLFRFFSDEKPEPGRFALMTGKLAGLTVLGVLIASVFFFPGMQRLIDSPRVTGNASYFAGLMEKPILSTATQIQYVTGILRAFGNDLIGNGSNFKGWYNYLEAPLFYIGLLPLLLFTQVFALVDRRRKVVYSLVIVLFVFSIIFPFFRNAFWAFTGDYYRGFSLFFSFFLLLFTLQSLTEFDKGKRVNLIVLGATLAVLLVLLHFPYKGFEQVTRTDLQSIATIFLFLYAIVILLFNFTASRTALKAVLVVLVVLELVWFNGKTVRDRVAVTSTEWSRKEAYNDYTSDAIALIRNRDREKFFRINKDYASGPSVHRSINDALVQDYYGSQCYSSFNQKYYIRFLEETGVIEKGRESATRWAPGVSTRPVLQMFASVKYNLSNVSKSFFQGMGNDSIGQVGNIKVLENQFYIPLGFTYDQYIPISEFRQQRPLQRDFTLLRAVVAEEPVDPAFRQFKELTGIDTVAVVSLEEAAIHVAARKADALQIKAFSENHLQGTIRVDKPKMLFFSIPFDKGWMGTIDGKKVEPMLCNAGFMGFFLDKGEHSVALDYSVYRIGTYAWMTVAGLLAFAGLALFRYRNRLFRKPAGEPLP